MLTQKTAQHLDAWGEQRGKKALQGLCMLRRVCAAWYVVGRFHIRDHAGRDFLSPHGKSGHLLDAVHWKLPLRIFDSGEKEAEAKGVAACRGDVRRPISPSLYL